MSNEQVKSLTTTVATAKIDSLSELDKLLAVAETQTINLIPKTMIFGTRPELILTTRLIFVNTNLKDITFRNKHGKDVTYKEKSNGDIYLVDSKSKKYALSSRMLKAIADAAGIIPVDLDRIGGIEYDENGRINYVKYKLIWERLDIDGTTKRGIAEGFYSFQAQVDKKKKDDDENADISYLEKQRGDGEKLAIANAYSRAIRDAIPQMPATFTLEELKKPLLVPSVTKDLSKLIEQYPNIQEALLAKELGVADLIYGAPKKQNQNERITLQHQTAEDAKIVDETKNKTPEEKQPEPSSQLPPSKTEDDKKLETGSKKVEEKPSAPMTWESNKIIAKEYLDQPENIRVTKIKELLIKKGRNWTGKKKIEEYTAQQQIKFIEDLLDLPDVAATEEKVFS